MGGGGSAKANSRDNAPLLGGWFGYYPKGTDGKFGLGDFICREAMDRLFHFNHKGSVSSPVKWGRFYLPSLSCGNSVSLCP